MTLKLYGKANKGKGQLVAVGINNNMGNQCENLCEKKSAQDEFTNDRKLAPLDLKRANQQQPIEPLQRKNRMLSPFQFFSPKRFGDNPNEQTHQPNLSVGTHVPAPTITPAAQATLSSLNPITTSSGAPPPPLQSHRPFQQYGKSSIYVGQWRNSHPHGFGKTYFPDGSLFQGEYIEGVPVGNGRYVNQDGNYYEGEIKAGRANGQGKFIAKNYKYQGMWRDDLPFGEGVEERAGDGEYLYEGSFERGRKVRGTLNWQQGKYVGSFEKDFIHGSGVLTTADGVYTGDFVNGKFHGQGEYVWADGARYKGEYMNGKKQGYGRYETSDQKYSYEGNWKGGVQHGGGKAMINGSQIQGKWQNGRLVQRF